jgi:hypothetical protein
MICDLEMGKLSISLTKNDEEKLRKIAEKNCRSLSGQISYWIKQEGKI